MYYWHFNTFTPCHALWVRVTPLSVTIHSRMVNTTLQWQQTLWQVGGRVVADVLYSRARGTSGRRTLLGASAPIDCFFFRLSIRCVVFESAGGHICAHPGRAKVAQTPGRARVNVFRELSNVFSCFSTFPRSRVRSGAYGCSAPSTGGETAPCSFPSIAKKREDSATKLSEPLPTSILHMKFNIYDRSAVSDVKVTTCYAILGQK